MWKDDDTPWSKGMHSRFIQLRSDNPNLKLLLALGHVTLGPQSLFEVAYNETSQNDFARKATQYIRTKGFDGLHLEWSNFTYIGYPSYDRGKFLNLVKSIRAAFNKSTTKTQPKLILTVSLSAIKKQIDTGDFVQGLNKVVDFISIRTVDMRTAADKRVGLSSALFSNPKAAGDDRYLSVVWVMNYYQSLGVPSSKLNIGVSTYGRTFTLRSAQKSNIGDAAIANGGPERWSASPGMIAYYELCYLFRTGGKIINVAAQKGRYYVNEDQWISYEDIYGVIQKTCYMRKNGFGGLTFWTLDLDDFTGDGCGQGKYPLITTAVTTLHNPDLSVCEPVDRHTFVDVPTSLTSAATADPTQTQDSKDKRVVCYFINWAFYRRGKGKFLPENINPIICTHIVYAYAWIRNNVITPFSQEDESERWREGMFRRVLKLKNLNSKLQILLAVGGYSAGSSAFENVSQNEETRRSFAKQAITFLREREFDGLEVDWQYVTADYKSYNTLLLQTVRIAFDEDAAARGKPPLLLSVTLPAGKKWIDAGYIDQLKSLVVYTDFVSILTYDFHGSWDIFTGFNSPLYARPGEHGEARYLNVDWIVRYYVYLGVPKYHINIGIATYGRSFTLKDTRNSYVGSMVMRTGEPGTFTGKPGILAYYEVCDFIDSGASVVEVHSQRALYAFKDYQWVGYDDINSVTAKACYALDEGYGGVHIWSLDYDDFTGDSCQEGKFPLTTTAFRIMQNIDLKICSSYRITPSVSGTCLRLHGSGLLYVGALLLWPGLGFGLT